VSASLTPAALETRGLTVQFGGHVAVNQVSASFHAGTLTAIVGPNGAGKTTFFNLVSGQLRATAGQVLVRGEDISSAAAPTRARLGLGRAFQLTNLFPNLTVHENVRLAVQAERGLGLSMWRMSSSDRDLASRADQVLEEVALQSKSSLTASVLSHNDQRKLEVALLIALKPSIFMFDEPTAGMSVDEVPVILDLIRRLKEDKSKTILLVEHKLDVVRQLADRIVVLHNGALVADGAPAEVIASAVVQEAYLGVPAVTPRASTA
jgi:branched-chain amino acid transport system ATP-binding protein